MSSNTPAIMVAVEEEPSMNPTSMQCHATEVDALKTQNGKLVQSNCALQSELNELGRRVQALEYDHNALEQDTHKFNAEIHSVLEHKGENPQDIVMKIHLKMSVDVTTQDIDIVHRLFRKSQAIKPIIVRRFHLKETNITEIIGIAQGYADGRIFVNKNLTQYRHEVLAKARKMKKVNKIFRV
ncbi:unnamed protein product [Pocillopora meandrina]|uniref:Uncharacterized protein n=1 Tax=Pocillopora meandrina TaxID=46732 RepID=A0AAU9WGX3_9CNID|nr:unnamed protein product [Pocillopora meandrina]